VKTFAVIPALNEEKTIAEVLKGLMPYAFKTIVVNDNSTDNTATAAKNAGAIVLTNSKRAGYEKSLERGILEAVSRKADAIFTFDADGQHSVTDIPKMLAPIEKGEADIVVGEREERFRRPSEALFKLYFKGKTGLNDPVCGLKAYNAEVFRKIGFFDRVGSIGTEIVLVAARAGFKIAQKKIKIRARRDSPRFGNRISGNLKMVAGLFKLILKYGL